MQSFAFDDNGNELREVAPDLGQELGERQRGVNRMKSSNPTVQKAIDSYTMGDLARILDDQVKRNGELEGRIRALSDELRSFSDKQKSEMGRIESEADVKIKTFTDRIEDGFDRLDKLDKSFEEVFLNLKNESEQKNEELAARYDRVLAQKEKDLSNLLSRATMGSLSTEFEKKQEEEKESSRKYAVGFYIMLVIFCMIGTAVGWINMSGITDINAEVLFQKIPKTLIMMLPLYVPTIWAICFLNKRLLQTNRLAEEYAFRRVVAQTYVGLSGQLEELTKKGVDSAKDLSKKLLESTISVICTNPTKALDKVKAQTPLNEVVDGVAKLMDSSTAMITARK